MKNLKTNQFYSFLLLFLFSALMIGCENMPSTTGDADTAVEEEASSETDESTSTTATEPASNQEIHHPKRSDNYLDFAHFGHFDLAHWEAKDNGSKSESDGEMTSVVYTKGDRVLEVKETNRGDNGFSHEQIFKDVKGKVLKKRTFNFSTDLNAVEEIHDHEAGKIWSRTQKMDKKYASNDKTLVMLAEFKESDIK